MLSRSFLQGTLQIWIIWRLSQQTHTDSLRLQFTASAETPAEKRVFARRNVSHGREKRAEVTFPCTREEIDRKQRGGRGETETSDGGAVAEGRDCPSRASLSVGFASMSLEKEREESCRIAIFFLETRTKRAAAHSSEAFRPPRKPDNEERRETGQDGLR